MKRFPAFTLIFLSSFFAEINACGYYPMGEDIRFSFLKPNGLGFEGFWQFNYNCNFYYDDLPDEKRTNTPNNYLWQSYCGEKISLDEINDAVYKIPASGINAHSKNKMVAYLFRQKDLDAINYLIFAKNCEKFTNGDYNAWEKAGKLLEQELQSAIKTAITNAAKTKNEMLKQRYGFMAIRLAAYAGDYKATNRIFGQYFKNAKVKNLIYYWSLSFWLHGIDNPALVNFYAAQVFANAPDKRFSVKGHYDADIPIAETIRYAKTKEEIANIWLIASIRKLDGALPEINQMYQNNPKSEALNFMLLREINKVEDWILTPQYSLFLPSTRPDYWENSNASRILQRVEIDRMYVRKLLGFVSNADLKKVDNPHFWKLSEAHLLFLTKDYNRSLQEISQLEKALKKTDPIYQKLLLVKGLCLTANQEKGKAVVPEMVKPLLMEQHKLANFKYIFAIGRELEQKGNSDDAALLFSKAEADYEEDNEYYGDGRYPYWKTRNDNYTLHYDYYESYDTYLDAFYTAAQIISLREKMKAYHPANAFSVWEFSKLRKNLPLLDEMLATIYIRQNKLQLAYEAYKKMGPHDFGAIITDPFLNVKGIGDFSKPPKTKWTKALLTEKLIGYIEKAENPAEKNRDYYYFLVANCYYNMSYFGHSWEMRRIYRTTRRTESKLVDEEEYKKCLFAHQYYTKALLHAKTGKFRALCYRMLAMCEANKYSVENNDDNWSYMDDSHTLLSSSESVKALSAKYPDAFKELTGGNCTFFEDYFKARR